MNTTPSAVPPPPAHRTNTSRQIIRSLKAKADEQRTSSERVADWMTEKLGSMEFLMVNIVWFLVWIVLNLNVIPSVKPFDPFPFGLLTMIVSLEAIILAIFVLISQNRAEKVDDLREEVDLQVDMIAEREITKVLGIVSQLAQKNGIDLTQDKELQGMLSPTNTEKIKEVLERQIR